MGDENWIELGHVINELARRRGIDGPYEVGKYVYEKTGRGPKTNKRGQGSSQWSQVYRGETEPSVPAMRALVDAMELNKEEITWLAEVLLREKLRAAVAA